MNGENNLGLLMAETSGGEFRTIHEFLLVFEVSFSKGQWKGQLLFGHRNFVEIFPLKNKKRCTWSFI